MVRREPYMAWVGHGRPPSPEEDIRSGRTRPAKILQEKRLDRATVACYITSGDIEKYRGYVLGSPMAKSPKIRAAELARKLGTVRPRDLVAAGIPRHALYQLVEDGGLVRTARGLYIPADADVTADHSLAEASKLVPKGTVCLLSALAFHELTTALPHEIWMAIPEKAWLPKVSRPRVRFVRFSGKALSEGVETHVVEHVPVKVYSPAKTVADCFKYRKKIGLDIAMESLRETWREKRATIDELWEFAKICRVANVMRPYLEAITS
jgi:hypothetical protein